MGLSFEHLKLRTECQQAVACYGWNTIILLIRNNFEQCFDAIATNARNNAILGQVGADCVDSRSALAHKQMPRAMKH